MIYRFTLLVFVLTQITYQIYPQQELKYIGAGNSEGITVQRQSKRINMWLYDLWLAEYLLDKIGDG